VTADESALEDEYADRFAAEEEAIVRGGTVRAHPAADTPPELGCRLDRDLACARLLRAVLRSPATVVAPPGSPGAVAQQAPGVGRPAAPVVPGYEILSELGRGGMGVVYRARQVGLNREVALKMVLGDHWTDPRGLIRFLAEAEAVAAVRHPRVVQVHEFGDAGGRPFLVMEYLPGGTLAERLRVGRLDPRVAAGLVAELARGVAAAHELGIVHRDLKPGNVLFDASGGPKVADFGMAKRGAGHDLTATRAVMGTPAYMAPEQARGESKFVGPPADVWALGAILYECLTGTSPFPAAHADAVLCRIRADDPVPVRSRAPSVPRDLERVCLKCLEKAPGARYPGAGELAADLDRFLAGEPVSVRAVGPIERLAKWARRKPALATAWTLAAVAVVLGTFAVFSAWLWQGAVRDRGAARTAQDEADAQRTAAEVARDELAGVNRKLDVALADAHTAWGEAARDRNKVAVFEHGGAVQLAYQGWREGNLAAARRLLAGTRKELRGWEYDYVFHRLCHGDLLTLQVVAPAPMGPLNMGERAADIMMDALGPSSGGALSVSWSPDGARVLTGASDGLARVWDARTGAELLTLKGHTGAVQCAAWSRDGGCVATAGSDGTVRLWDSATGKERLAFRASDRRMYSVSFNPDGSRLVVGGVDGTARVWEVPSTVPEGFAGKELLSLKEHTLCVESVSWSPNGARIVTGSLDGTAKVWDAATGKELLVLKGHGLVVNSVAWSPNGARIVTGSGDGTAKVWDVAGGKELVTLKGHVRGVTCAAWSPDGVRVAVTCDDGLTSVWEAATGRALIFFRGHTGPVHSVSWSPDGARVVTASRDGTARVWDTLITKEYHTLALPRSGAFSAAWSPDGTRVVLTTNPDRTVRVRDAGTGRELLTLKIPTPITFSGPWSPDGLRLLTGSNDGTARVWNARKGAEMLVLKGHAGVVACAAWSRDGTRIVTVGLDRTARVWDAADGKELLVLRGHTQSLTCAAWSADGARVVTGSDDTTARVWDAVSGKELFVLREHTAPVNSAHWSPDGSRIVTAGAEGTARVWDAATGKEQLTLAGDGASVNTIRWNPDGSRLVTVGIDGNIRIWETRTGAQLLVLKSYAPGLQSAEWSLDGSRLLTAASDGSVRVWDARPVNRAFLPQEPAPPPGPVR
jgi:WD40 repeat protein